MIVEFHRCPADEISAADLHDLLRLRGEVFVVEQQCLYADVDGRDMEECAEHWWFTDGSGVAAALRVLVEPDGSRRIGRVVTRSDVRGGGLAARLLVGAIASVDTPFVVSAQAHLEGWYARFGFDAGAEPRRFDEDGIPHVAMTRPAGIQPVAVSVVEADDPELVAVVDEVIADLTSRYPGMEPVDPPGEIVAGGGTFVVIRVAGVAMACGAVRRLDDGRAELKRMYVRPEMRGRGLVRRLLAALEDEAVAMGHDALWLVTGHRQPEAVRAYEREGFVRTAPWGRWVDIPLAVCMVREIER